VGPVAQTVRADVTIGPEDPRQGSVPMTP
jgi:hypothetical protein